MYQQQPDGSIADVGDTISVDTQVLKQTVYDFEHAYIKVINGKTARDDAQAKIDAIKVAVPAFDDTPLDVSEHAQALALFAAQKSQPI